MYSDDDRETYQDELKEHLAEAEQEFYRGLVDDLTEHLQAAEQEFYDNHREVLLEHLREVEAQFWWNLAKAGVRGRY
jgi:hypothetical protein